MKKLLTISLLTVFLISCGGKTYETEKELDNAISKIIFGEQTENLQNYFDSKRDMNYLSVLAQQPSEPLKRKEEFMKSMDNWEKWAKTTDLKPKVRANYLKKYKLQREEFLKNYPQMLKKYKDFLLMKNNAEITLIRTILLNDKVSESLINQKINFVKKRQLKELNKIKDELKIQKGV